MSQWIEDRIVKTAGMEYRRKSLVSWNPENRVKIPTEEMGRDWRLLGTAMRTLITNGHPPPE